MKNIKLYVADWAPNGTNDLLIVKDGKIIECVEQATFGIDVFKAKPRERATADDIGVFSGHISAEEYDPQLHALLKRVGKDELRRKFCISPTDPNGADLVRRLLRAGVKL